MLIEPPSRINGDDKTKARSTRINEEQDAKVAAVSSDSNATGPMSNNSVQNGSDNKQSKKSSGDARSKSGKAGNISTTASTSAQPPKPQVEGMNSNALNSKDTTLGAPSEKSPAPSVESGGEKVAVPSPAARPALEENIVLGVALEGSKRTLPIDDEISSSQTHMEVKETAARRGGNVSLSARKDRKDNRTSSVPGSSAGGDQRDQER